MNKTAIKNFAVEARVQLIEAVKQRAYEYEITEDGENRADLESIGGHVLSAQVKEQRRELISQIQHKGYTQVMEEAAYTWFNRFIALRFMEVNSCLPSKVRVFTDENGAFKPEVLKQAMSVELDGLDKNKVLQLLDAQANEELYKYLLITQCNELNRSLPEMFETISNWTELLFPANLLRSDSVLDRMVTEIPEEDWQDAVQIIGWLYQYYNTELKDDTFAKLKKNIKITKERIPAATQLFTPDWIVRYMVENSLGRLWLEGHPDAELHDGWKYYLDEAEQEPEVEAQLAKLREEYKAIKPEEIKVIDPCMGSGHILVYAFDVLMQIYTSAGWDQREAAQSILKNNLYGLDIDDRAAQLAYFAVMMKARKYDRRLLTRGIQPNIFSIRESNGIQAMTIEYFHKNDPKLQADIESIVTEMRDAKEYGSILNITPVDFAGLYARFDEIRNDISLLRKAALAELLPLVKCAEMLAQKYDVVVTNPPYMAVSNAGAKVNDYVKKNFPDSKADMFAVFIERCGQMIKKNGYQAMITQHAWMFLSSFEKLRTKLLAVDIVNMAHLGARAFEEIGGEVVQTTSFVIRKSHIADYKGEYCRLIEPTSQQGKEDMFLAGENRYAADQSNFSKIPGSPVAYWVGENFTALFDGKTIRDIAFAGIGMRTGDNDRYLRFWHEIERNKMYCSCANAEEALRVHAKWIPYNKGGEFRRWYGNNEYVVNWENNGKEIKDNTRRVYPQLGDNLGWKISNEQYYFHEGITWTVVSSKKTSFRRYYQGAIISNSGQSVISDNTELLDYLTGLLNTNIVADILAIISPTIGFESGYINKIPVIYDDNKSASIQKLAKCNINWSRDDWDSYETSWDFKRNPLV
jgi:hypothetical protein